MQRCVLTVLVALLVLMLMVSACVPTPAPSPSESAAPSSAQPERPLVVLIDNDEGPITPVNFNTFIGFWMIGWVYDPLFVRSPELVPVPARAAEAK